MLSFTYVYKGTVSFGPIRYLGLQIELNGSGEETSAILIYLYHCLLSRGHNSSFAYKKYEHSENIFQSDEVVFSLFSFSYFCKGISNSSEGKSR